MATATKIKSIKHQSVGQRIAAEFKAWLEINPKATKAEKIEAFDEIADEVIGR